MAFGRMPFSVGGYLLLSSVSTGQVKRGNGGLLFLLYSFTL